MQEPREAILVRLPIALKQLIERDAAANRRSATRELQVVIEQHYQSSQSIESNACADRS